MYVRKVKRDIARWVELGLLPATTAEALVFDLDSRGNRLGIAQILLILAAIFLSAALLLLVSANWEAVPRLVRLGVVLALIWLCHLGGALLFRAGRETLGAAALLLGTAAFGGGLALVGQMYHISGDAVSMFAVWFLVTALTSVLFRSGAVAVAAGLLTFVLCWSIVDTADGAISDQALFTPLALAAVMAGLAAWSGQEKAAHFSFLLLLGWAVWLYSQFETPYTAASFVVIGFVLFVALSFSRSPFARFGEAMAGAPSLYALLLCAIGLLILHIQVQGSGLVLVAVIGLALSVSALALGGRDHGGIRWLCYGMIAAIVFYLWVETIGSILGTSGFFLVAALVAGGLALAVVRVEKLLARKGRTS